jgi:tetratricopeptide (TPR) repeat protein
MCIDRRFLIITEWNNKKTETGIKLIIKANYMKIKYIILLSICFAFCGVISGQDYKGGITFYQHQLMQKGDSLYIDFEIVTRGQCVASDEYLTLTPMLKLGESAKRLPAVILNGKKRQKLYNRMLVLDKNNNQALGAVVIDTQKQEQNSFPYRLTIPFEDWMKEASLVLEQMTCGCGKQQREVSVEMLANSISLEQLTPVFVSYNIKPQVNYIVPEVEAIKQRHEEVSAYLDFRVGSSIIMLEYGNNPAELAKINKLIAPLKDNQNVQIKEMLVTGYASPEGTYASNLKLSEARAASLKGYLQKMYGFSNSQLHSGGKGEDWDGLVKMIEESDLTYKDEALEIIRTTDIFDGREKKMMLLQGGNPYRQMKENLFPKLRRVEFSLNYMIKPFSIEEGKEMININPSFLSLNEIYLIANSYDKESPEFKNVFDIAVRLYPNNPVANINAAAVALEAKETTTAKRFLGKVKDQKDAWNNLGVLYLLEGEYEKAKEYFEKAKAAGIPEAAHNLIETEKKMQNLSQINH